MDLMAPEVARVSRQVLCTRALMMETLSLLRRTKSNNVVDLLFEVAGVERVEAGGTCARGFVQVVGDNSSWLR